MKYRYKKGRRRLRACSSLCIVKALRARHARWVHKKVLRYLLYSVLLFAVLLPLREADNLTVFGDYGWRRQLSERDSGAYSNQNWGSGERGHPALPSVHYTICIQRTEVRVSKQHNLGIRRIDLYLCRESHRHPFSFL